MCVQYVQWLSVCLFWTFFLVESFRNCFDQQWETKWKKIDPMLSFPKTMKFLHSDLKECKCHSKKSKLIWGEACKHIQTKSNNALQNTIHFHPRTNIDCRPHSVARGHKTICFTVHVDDLTVRHQKVKGSSYTTIGLQIHNVRSKTKRHQYYFRTVFLPANKKKWTVDHQLELISRELKSMEKGIPMPVPGHPGCFHLVKFVCLGVIADGPAIGKLLGRTGLNGYCGAQLVRENLRYSKTFIGTSECPVFTSRRYITNKVFTSLPVGHCIFCLNSNVEC